MQLSHSHSAGRQIETQLAAAHLEAARLKHPKKKKRCAHWAVAHTSSFLYRFCNFLEASCFSLSATYSRKPRSACRLITDDDFCLARLEMSHLPRQKCRAKDTPRSQGCLGTCGCPQGKRLEGHRPLHTALCRLSDMFVLVSPPLQWGCSSPFHVMHFASLPLAKCFKIIAERGVHFAAPG